jgi:hypothetical protein
MGNYVIFHPEAEEEYNEAIFWYSNQQKGLDLEFVLLLMRLFKK